MLIYPDSRRKALTCGGGAVSIVRFASASFNFVYFAGNSAPRGGAVCVHDGAASYQEVIFLNNVARHTWFGQPSGFDVECVQCFGSGDDPTPVSAIDRCAYRRDSDATAQFETVEGLRPVCAPPSGALTIPPLQIITTYTSSAITASSSSSSSSFAGWWGWGLRRDRVLRFCSPSSRASRNR